MQRPRLFILSLILSEYFRISRVGDLGLEGSGEEKELGSCRSTLSSEETFFSCSTEGTEDEFGGTGGLGVGIG